MTKFRSNRSDAAVENGSDAGVVREYNEDAFGFFEPQDDDLFAERGRLLIVADGMGGEAGGLLASSTLVEVVSRDYFSRPGRGIFNPERALTDAINAASAAICELIAEQPELEGMGTTAVCLVERGREAWIANVGDSRAYLQRGSTLRQITRDNSTIQEAMDRKGLSRAVAEESYPTNLLTRAVGAGEPAVEVDIYSETLNPGDRVLLCSDGLHGEMDDDEISGVLRHTAIDQLCSRLIMRAKQHGGNDNITVMALAIVDPVHDDLRPTPVDNITVAKNIAAPQPSRPRGNDRSQQVASIPSEPRAQHAAAKQLGVFTLFAALAAVATFSLLSHRSDASRKRVVDGQAQKARSASTAEKLGKDAKRTSTASPTEDKKLPKDCKSKLDEEGSSKKPTPSGKHTLLEVLGAQWKQANKLENLQQRKSIVNQIKSLCTLVKVMKSDELTWIRPPEKNPPDGEIKKAPPGKIQCFCRNAFFTSAEKALKELGKDAPGQAFKTTKGANKLLRPNDQVQTAYSKRLPGGRFYFADSKCGGVRVQLNNHPKECELRHLRAATAAVALVLSNPTLFAGDPFVVLKEPYPAETNRRTARDRLHPTSPTKPGFRWRWADLIVKPFPPETPKPKNPSSL